MRPEFKLIEHHKGVDIAILLVIDQGIADFVLDVAGADAFHALVLGFFAQFFDIVVGEAWQRFAVVKLQLLEQG